MADFNSDTAVVGIIGAMDVEVDSLRDAMTERDDTEIAQILFSRGAIAGVSCVVAKCAVGKVNAALCAQILIDRFDVTHVINTGAAGAIDASLNIFDFVVSTDCVEHDMEVSNFGYELGQVPGLSVGTFKADKVLQNAAIAAIEQSGNDACAMLGRIASGDQFVRDDAVKRHIAQEFDAACCEMEGAAIAHACWLNGVPFVVIRAISDKADGSQAIDYLDFETRAAKMCAHVTEQLLAELA